MSVAPNSDQIAPGELQADVTRLQLAWLAEAGEIGMKIARDLGRQADEGTQPDTPDLAIRYARVTRAIRQIIALQQHVVSSFEQQSSGLVSSELFKRRKAVRRGVRNALDNAVRIDDPDLSYAEVGERVENLLADYDTYGDDDDLELDRPIGEIVSDICLALGVQTDPRVWDENGRALSDVLLPPDVRADLEDDDDLPDRSGLPSPHLRAKSRKSNRRANNVGPP